MRIIKKQKEIEEEERLIENSKKDVLKNHSQGIK